jgi:hypothetical protein
MRMGRSDRFRARPVADMTQENTMQKQVDPKVIAGQRTDDYSVASVSDGGALRYA